MVLTEYGKPLRLMDMPIPVAQENEILIKVHNCGVCRTDLHIVDGELKDAKLPLIPGHQVVGTRVDTGERVGVSWLGSTCGRCDYCVTDHENLCDNAKFTGYTLNGGFAEYCVARKDFCFPIPGDFADLQAAPLLCAGLVGYRAYRKLKDAKKIGIYGIGAAAHIIMQVAKHQGKLIYAFTRPDDSAAQQFAKELGATWVGSSVENPPELLDAAIIFAPVGALVPRALEVVKKGGTVVCGGIHMSMIPSFSYDLLWGERELCSVANLTRKDGIDFFQIAPKIPIHTKVNNYALIDVNQALDDLRNGKFTGAAVISL